MAFINRFIISKQIDIDINKFNSILDKLCGEGYPFYKRFNDDSLYGSLISLYFLGGYLRQMLFWYLIDNYYKKDNINNNIKDQFDIPKSNKNNGIEFDIIKTCDEENGSINESENDDNSSV